MDTRRLSDLSPAMRSLITLMNKTGYGTIERLHVRDGEPLDHPLPRVTRTVRFSAASSPVKVLKSDDYALKNQILTMVEEFDHLGDGIITRLEVQHGLPFRMEIEEIMPSQRPTDVPGRKAEAKD